MTSPFHYKIVNALALLFNEKLGETCFELLSIRGRVYEQTKLKQFELKVSFLYAKLIGL